MIPATVLLLMLAPAAAQPGELAGREQAYEAEVKLKPSAEAWQRLGLVRHLQNKYQPAIEAFQHALRLNPSLWTSHLFRGICEYRTNQFAAALMSLQSAAKLAPAAGQGRDEIDYWLGAARIARNQRLAGLGDLERLLGRRPKHQDALQLAARAYADLSSELWNQVGEQSPDTPAGWMVHGQVLESEANVEGALGAYQEVKKLRPAWPGPRLAIGRLLLTRGKPAEALAELREELLLSPGDIEASYYAGLAAAQLNLGGEAATLLQPAAKWYPDAALALAQVYLALRQPGKAAESARAAAAAAPDSQAAHELLLSALEQAGMDQEAGAERARWTARKP